MIPGRPGRRFAVAPTTAEQWNRIRFLRPGPIVESLFLKLHLPGEGAFWARYTLRRGPDGEWGGLWGVFSGPEGLAAACQIVPRQEVDIARDRLFLRIGPGELSMGRAVGTVSRLVSGSGAPIPGELGWDLVFSSGPTWTALPADFLQHWPFPRNKVVSPLAFTRFSGVIRLGPREIRVRQAPGMQGHNWGEGVAPRWAWGHVAGFEEDPDGVLEVVHGGIPAGPWQVPVTVALIRLGGREWRLNGPLEMARARSRVEGLRWVFTVRGAGLSLRGELDSAPDRTLGLDYRSSDGRVIRVTNSNRATASIEIDGPAWTGRRHLHASGTATLELGGDLAPRDLPGVVGG